jgi:D-alanyl-D-alanine carboxypeptidase
MPTKSFGTRSGPALAGLLAALIAVPLGLGSPASATTISTTTSPAATGLPPGVPTDHDLQAALDAVVAAGASGISLRVDDGRRSTRLAAGAARLDPRIPMRPGARVRVGSITKSFVATVTLQLVGEHRLRLDDTVQRWQPGLVPNGDHITVRQLLNHTSGIFDYTEDEAFLPAVLADPLHVYTPQQLVDIANAHPPVFAPGTSWSYSNTGYVVLGLILERVTHRPLQALIRHRIIDPLRLRNTYLPIRDPDISGYHAHGYVPPSLSDQIPPPRGGPNRYVDVTLLSPSIAWAAGALVSTPDDLHRFYRALLGGRLLRPAQLAAMKTMVEVQPGFGYGLGLYTSVTPCGQVWGHNGGIPGYVTFAHSDETGRRSADLALPTQPDDAIGTAGMVALDAAVCRMFRQPLPTGAAAAHATAARTPAPRLLDGTRPVSGSLTP